MKEFIVTDDTYKSGVLLDEYKGTFSLLNARENQAGEPMPRWCKPEIGKDKYADKNVPFGVRIGDRAKAIAVLQTFLRALEGARPEQQTFLGPDDEQPPF
jgi:hypothetical protein